MAKGTINLQVKGFSRGQFVTIAEKPGSRAERRMKRKMAGRMNSRGQFWGNPTVISGAFGGYLQQRWLAGKNVMWTKWTPGGSK